MASLRRVLDVECDDPFMDPAIFEAIKVLCDQEALSEKTQKRFIEMGAQDKAGLVQLQLASALQQLPLEDRWPLANALVSQDTFAKDPVFPLLVWYGINPAVTENRKAALELVDACA